MPERGTPTQPLASEGQLISNAQFRGIRHGFLVADSASFELRIPSRRGAGFAASSQGSTASVVRTCFCLPQGHGKRLVNGSFTNGRIALIRGPER